MSHCYIICHRGDKMRKVELSVNDIECIHSTGEYVTHLFFCDPHMSCQKGMIEKNVNDIIRM